MCGKSILGFLFMSTNAGDSELAFDVVLRANNAKYESPKQHLAFLNVFFTVSIALFTSPLLWGYSGFNVVSEVVYFSKFTKLPWCILWPIATNCFFYYTKSRETWFHFPDDFFTGEVLNLADFEVFQCVIYKSKVILIKTMKQISSLFVHGFSGAVCCNRVSFSSLFW